MSAIDIDALNKRTTPRWYFHIQVGFGIVEPSCELIGEFLELCFLFMSCSVSASLVNLASNCLEPVQAFLLCRKCEILLVQHLDEFLLGKASKIAQFTKKHDDDYN
jgi:hypothetical protein